jgi:hypothetical protein
MRRKHLVAALVLTFAGTALTAAAQPKEKSQRPSPPSTAEITLKGKKVSIAYSRPSMKGRKIMGGLVPYDKVWRTGANEATAFTTEASLSVGGTSVPAGSYTLYTLPSESAWKLIINKQTGQWGTEYDQSKDLARVNLTNSPSEKPVEQFTISLAKKGEDAADLVFEWENTRLTVPVKTR